MDREIVRAALGDARAELRKAQQALILVEACLDRAGEATVAPEEEDLSQRPAPKVTAMD